MNAFQELSSPRQFEIVGILAEVVANNNPELMEMIINQIEAEHGGDWWDELTEEQQQQLERSIREADERKTVSHERAQREVREWLKR